MFVIKMKNMLLTSVSAVGLVGVLLFESSDSNGRSVCSWRDRFDPAAHAKHQQYTENE